MPNLDAYPDTTTHLHGIHDYCPECGRAVAPHQVRCTDCTEQAEIDRIASMTTTEVFDELGDIFQGNEPPTFRWDDGMMELTYFGNELEVRKAKKLLEARGTVKLHTAEDRLCVWIGSYKDQLEIY